jgi:hypothetical protein
MSPVLQQVGLIASAATTIGAGASVVDETTLVPIGLLVMAVVTTATITSKVCWKLFSQQRDIEQMRQHITNLEHLYGRRRVEDQKRDSADIRQ